MPLRTMDLLDMVMSGRGITATELDELLTNRVGEDLFLDYKHGNELRDRKKGSATIRQYLTGFANSAGGVLLIGIDQASWSVTGCVAPGGGDLAEWAASCITQLTPFFSPMPRFQIVNHPDGQVLLAAASRSLGLISCVESSERVYYFRMHDETLSNKTVRAPEYLVTDLLLGRREQPYLYIADLGFGQLGRRKGKEEPTTDIEFGLDFHAENQNISWASDTILGIVAMAKSIQGRLYPRGSHLLSYIDIQEPDGALSVVHHEIGHTHVKMNEFGPFDVNQFANFAIYTVPLRWHETWYSYTWKAAAYILSRSTPPQWYQIELEINTALLTLISQHPEQVRDEKLLRIEPMVGQRPVVGWVDAIEI
jgi:hypothetical protein